MKHSVLTFIRRLVGINSVEARLTAMEEILRSIANDLANRDAWQNALSARQNALSATIDDLNRQLGHTASSLNGIHTQLETLSTHLLPKYAELPNRLLVELEACRRLAPRAIFVLGFARSSSTITTEIINSSSKALILSEANWYIPNPHPRFRDWYNAMHVQFANQIFKSTYAPDFLPEIEHDWWGWMEAASTFYPVLGDKMAFSAQHFRQLDPADILAFFEARFFLARYVFTIRDPIQTLLSTAHLFSIADDRRMAAEISAWLRFVQLWADWIRTFPNTLTVIADDLGPDSVAALQRFLDLDLGGAAHLLDPDERRVHQATGSLPILSQFAPALSRIFTLIRQSLDTDRVVWQADQKRILAQNDSRSDPAATIRIAPHPLGQTWVLAEDLLHQLTVPPSKPLPNPNTPTVPPA